MAEISKQLEEKIIAQVEKNRDEIIAFVQSAVRQPSVTGNEEGIAKVIYNKMLECGIDAEYLEAAPHRPNVVGHYRGEKPGKTLVFNGHMDICPPGPAEEWDFDPYSGEIKDGQLWGRGTVDMKSGDQVEHHFFLPGIDRLTDNIYPADPFCTDSCNPGSDLPQCFLHTCLFWLYSDLNFCIHISDK